MSRDWYADVRQFMAACDQLMHDRPTLPEANSMLLSNRLIMEEYEELRKAMAYWDQEGMAKEGVDLIYVVLGNFARNGIDPGPIWDAVHADNMRKSTGAVDDFGKRLKPPDWEATPIQPLIDAQSNPTLTEE